jgi:hypothetical protein
MGAAQGRLCFLTNGTKHEHVWRFASREMSLVAPLRQYRLSALESSGLSCSPTGLFLSGVPLLQKTETGFAPRQGDELDALMKAAYGGGSTAGDLNRGLNAAANALNRDDVVRPELDLEDIYHPYESYSPGQNDQTRQPDMPNVPGVRSVYGRRYKAWSMIRSPYFRYIGLTSACS